MPKVSVIVNCLNGERYLKEALDSVYAQTYADWEIIFIDNASTDKSASIARANDDRLKYHRLPHTLPLYAARNVGLQQVSGELVAFLDVDDSWSETKLAKQVDIMQAHPAVYLVCSGFLRKNERLGTLTRQVARTSTFLTFEKTLAHYPINLSMVMLRFNETSRDTIQFVPTLNLTGDYELFVKLIYRYQAYYLAEPLGISRVHTTNLSAKLVKDWPQELEQTHARLIEALSPSAYEKKLMDKRYRKACGLVYLAGGEFQKARRMIQAYFFNDPKCLLIYLSTFNRFLAKWVLQVRGF